MLVCSRCGDRKAMYCMRCCAEIAAAHKAEESPATVTQQLKECNSLLSSVAFALELYSPNHQLLAKVDEWQATASV